VGIDPLYILIAQPADEVGLERTRQIAPGLHLELVDPFGPDHVLPDELAHRTVVLFSDVAPANAADMASLRWIQLSSHGYSQFNGRVLPAGTQVCNASGVNDITIAEWCVMMMLALHRDLPSMLADQRAHRWNRAITYQAELCGRRVGILGYGNIGQELARRCRALGLQVWVLSRFRPGARDLRYHPVPAEIPTPDRMFTVAERGEFYSGIDILVVTTPVTSATRGLVDAAALAALPRHAVLLNPARAGVVDEVALLAALRSRRIAGAALDDHYRSPMPPDDPFWDLPNVIISPHVSGSNGSTFFVERIWDLFNRNLQRFLVGEPLLNRISADDLELGTGEATG
jgi:phosphoglycerate dehydrogenase-like enzyme